MNNLVASVNSLQSCEKSKKEGKLVLWLEIIVAELYTSYGLQMLSFGMMCALSVCSSRRVQSIAHFNLASEDTVTRFLMLILSGIRIVMSQLINKENSRGFYPV